MQNFETTPTQDLWFDAEAENLRSQVHFEKGWPQILGVKGSDECKLSLKSLTDLTVDTVQKSGEPNINRRNVSLRWCLAVEFVGRNAVQKTVANKMTEARVIETALQVIEANLGAVGWLEEGYSFMVPDANNDGSPVVVDLREIGAPIETAA